MNKYNTILGQMLQFISRSRFENQVKEYQTERGAKGLRSWTQFVTMLFGQISGRHGLRSIEQGMNSQRNSWYHMGITNTQREIKPQRCHMPTPTETRTCLKRCLKIS